MELWDIYDEKRNKTGRTHERGVPLAQGDYHLVVHVWIVNSRGEYLIQRRQPWKKSWPGLWDCAAAGAAQVGDDSAFAARREVLEELGIALDMKRAQMLFTIRFERGFDDIWLAFQDIEIEDIKLQYEEVADAKWVTKEEIRTLMQSGEFVPHTYIERLFEQVQTAQTQNDIQ